MGKVEPGVATGSAERPLVSATMATWNGEHLLAASIESALAQTYAPMEVIVVDDGSTDSTPEICRAYGDRIRYIRQPKDDSFGGSAIIRGYQEARGTYIACLDHDDLWHPEKIARQVAAMMDQPEAGAVFTRFRIIDELGRDQGVSPLTGQSGDMFHQLLESNVLCYSSGMFRKEALDRVGFHDIYAGIGDWDHWLRIARAYPVIMLEEVLTDYRVHARAYSAGRSRMIEAAERVIANQRPRLHPDCAECRGAIARAHNHLASDWMAHALTSLENDEPRVAVKAIKEAWRLSPGSVAYWLRHHPLSLARTWLSASLARRRRNGTHA